VIKVGGKDPSKMEAASMKSKEDNKLKCAGYSHDVSPLSSTTSNEIC
jgi:hypothetical protein